MPQVLRSMRWMLLITSEATLMWLSRFEGLGSGLFSRLPISRSITPASLWLKSLCRSSTSVTVSLALLML